MLTFNQVQTLCLTRQKNLPFLLSPSVGGENIGKIKKEGASENKGTEP
jgi:hypothetical protein